MLILGYMIIWSCEHARLWSTIAIIAKEHDFQHVTISRLLWSLLYSSSIFWNFGSLEKDCLNNNDANGFRLARVKNQREIELESKDAVFYSFSRRRNFHLNKKKIYRVKNFDWMIVKLCMYAT